MTRDGGRTLLARDHSRAERVIRSAVWAAWADALGFISELTDERGLQRRLGKNGSSLVVPVEWRRRVGGKFGAEAVLPAGCYSDDTQLRLAVGRAVTGGGFDVEAFARVELPVWPSYALGGGHASKAGAKNLAKPDAAWFANFYEGWTNSGGNGAAMRIQPHVWSATDPAGLGPHLVDVVADAVTTHGHPRALFGAVLHAAALGDVLSTGTVPSPDRWQSLLATATAALPLVQSHTEIDGFWRPTWERQAGKPFADAWNDTAAECEKLLALAADIPLDAAGASDEGTLTRGYASLVAQLGLSGDEFRGSGTHTVVAALALSAAVGSDVRAAAVTASGAIGTDTDTIATMAAAVSAAADGAEPVPDVLDGEYIVREAERLALIAAGETTERFSYPDLLNWVAPRTQSDACGLVGDQLALAGIGWCEPVEEFDEFESRGSIWRWLRTDFGQTVLAKQRTELQQLPKGAWPTRRVVVDTGRRGAPRGRREGTPEEPPPRHDQDHDGARRGAPHSTAPAGDNSGMAVAVEGRATSTAPDPGLPFEADRPREVSVDALFAWARRHRFSADALGKAVRRLAEVGTVDQMVAFTVLVHAEARRLRRDDGSTLY